MNNGQNAARSRHLEELANAAKRYTLREILDVTEAVAAELGGLSSPNYDDFTGATSIAGGISGLVPAPQAGDESKFLRGDGVWATVESGSAGGAVDYVIGSKVSSVEGGFWQDTFNDTPVLKLRHGDYEYNFVYDNITYLGGASAPLVNTTPNTYVLGTASVSNDGGVWYEVNNDVPTLNLHKGSFNYSFNYDRITYRGDNSNLAAYLPFNVSPTADACGNEWTTTGNPTIVDNENAFGGKELYCDSSSYVTCSNITLDSNQWTVDFWVTIRDGYLWVARSLSTGGDQMLQMSNGYVNIYFPAFPIIANASRTPLQKNKRYHIALTFDQPRLRVFVDGQLNIDASYDGEMILTSPISIPPKGSTHGYSCFRIFKGQCLWTSDFTPPTDEDYM